MSKSVFIGQNSFHCRWRTFYINWVIGAYLKQVGVNWRLSVTSPFITSYIFIFSKRAFREFYICNSLPTHFPLYPVAYGFKLAHSFVSYIHRCHKRVFLFSNFVIISYTYRNVKIIKNMKMIKKYSNCLNKKRNVQTCNSNKQPALK